MFYIFHTLINTFEVWYRKRSDPDALWAPLPYAGRNRAHAQDLIEYYESEWGNLYDYEIVKLGNHPMNGAYVPV